MTSRGERAPSSLDSIGTFSSADGSRDLPSASADESRYERRNGGRRRRRKGEKKKRSEKFGKDVQKMMTPAVKILLLGVLMSLGVVMWISEHLDKSLEMQHSVGKELANPSENEIESKEGNVDRTIGREPILKIIKDAGISFDPVKDADLIAELPLWKDVVELYGPEPVIYGMNEGNCQRFQEHSEKAEHFIGTAGTFNSGTNLMSELLIANCMMPARMKKYGNKSRGIRWQVPWGKHAPVGDKEYRESHKTVKDKEVDANEIMPMVTIRDPLIWLKSMCRHKYTAKWIGFQDKENCPNFSMKDLKVNVKYDGFIRQYESLLYLWNDYYNEYKNVDIPFLLVRFEDLVFHTEETVTKVCECAGGMRTRQNFKYIVNSAKKGAAAHGAMNLRTGFVDALVKYGKIEKRYKGFEHASDLEYVKEHIDQSLMEMMNYKSIDPSWHETQAESTI